MLLNRLASYRHGALAACAQARPLVERVLAINEKALGPEHPSTATSLNNLAALLRDQGDLVGARPLAERALPIYEETCEHAWTATSLDSLAQLLQVQGDFAGARPLYGDLRECTRSRASLCGDEPQQSRGSASRPGRLLRGAAAS